MTHEEFKDHLFDILNDTEVLPIADIETNEKESFFKVILTDGSEFTVSSKPYGRAFLLR